VKLLSKLNLKGSFVQLAAILFLVEFVRGAYLVSFLPTYAMNVLGFSVSVVGIAVSVHYVSDTVIKSFAGYLLDHFSLRIIVHQAWILVTAAAIFGIGISPIWLVCLSKVEEEQRASQMGMLYTVWLVGLGTGSVLINFFIDKGYVFTFWIMVSLWTVGWIIAFRLKNKTVSAPQYSPLHSQLGLLLNRLRTMKPLLPGMILQTTAVGILLPILPGFAAKSWGISHAGYSFVLIAGGAMTAAFLIPMGKWSDRVGRKWFLICGFGLFSIALYNMTRITTLTMAKILAGTIGCAYAAVLPTWNALLADYVPKEQQGMGWGLFSSVEGIGVIIGPIIGGWLADTFNESIVVVTSAILLGGIALLYFFVPVERVKEYG
jgi:MFS family permease